MTRTMPVVYLAGPFRAANAWLIEKNIRTAETQALDIWRLGGACICPHTNTRFFQGAASDDLWLKGDLAIVAKCDVLVTTQLWYTSEGAKEEVSFAGSHQIPVCHGMDEFREWLKTWRGND